MYKHADKSKNNSRFFPKLLQNTSLPLSVLHYFKYHNFLIIFNSVLAIKIGFKANSTGLSHTVIKSGFL